MDRRLEALWRQRAAAFRREAQPYVQYMGQSGFPGFVILLLIVGFIGYGAFLRDIPAHFPIVPVGAAALTPAIAWNPLRTWLAPADTVFLMPREAEMRAYLARSFRHTAIPAALLSLAVLLLYLPLYGKIGPQPAHGWAALAAGVLVLRAAGAFGAWQERRMVWPAARRGLRLLRWLMTALAAYALLDQPLWRTAVFALLLAVCYAAAVRLTLRHRFPWERLIDEEERTRSRYYRFFGAFIDVPIQSGGVSRRSYAAWLAARIRYRRDNAFVFLYALSLLRTELGGMLLRLTALGMLAVYLTGSAGWLDGWGAAAVQLIFAVIIGSQLGALPSAHRHAVWRHIYPLPEAVRQTSAAAVVRAALAGAAALLWLTLAAALVPSGDYAPAAGALAASAYYALRLRPRRLLRRMRGERDDD